MEVEVRTGHMPCISSAGQRPRFTAERMVALFTAEELARLLLLAWEKLRWAEGKLEDSEGIVIYAEESRCSRRLIGRS